jgi:NAD(P)-dependent dehydrogenase (short-subunit alcohol dehydrogenase family)
MKTGVLSGRVALVTGASSGLGRRFAEVLARSGARVVAAGRRQDRLAALTGELVGAGAMAVPCALDVCDAASISAAVDFAEQQFGTVDILVNNAGVADGNYATKLPLGVVDRVIDTNFRGVFLTAVEVARRLIDAGAAGSIVNVSSLGAFHYAPRSAAALYAATKAGVIRLTETLAIEWASFNINVNAIAPGFFRSEMTDGYIERAGDKVKDRFPRQRFGEPEYLDSTLLYLVSPESHFVTGTCILADDAQTPR